MNRLENWASRLADCIGAAEKKPFEWGAFDCALFACDCALAITGVDHAAEFRGKYTTELGATRLLKSIGGGDLCGTAFLKLGTPWATPLLAQRGDAVLFDSPLGPTLGIVALDGRTIVAPSLEGGLARYPLARAQIAWAV